MMAQNENLIVVFIVEIAMDFQGKFRISQEI